MLLTLSVAFPFLRTQYLCHALHQPHKDARIFLPQKLKKRVALATKYLCFSSQNAKPCSVSVTITRRLSCGSAWRTIICFLSKLLSTAAIRDVVI